MKREQFSVGNYMYPHHSFEYFLNSMNRIGVETIEIWGATPHIHFEDFSLAEASGFDARIRAHGLKVCCVTPEQCMYPINLGAANPDTRRRSIDVFKKAVDLATVLGAEKALCTSGHRLYDEDPSECWKRCVESYQELASYARSRGVCMVLEPLTRRGIDMIVYAEEEKRMLDDVGDYDGIKAMIDTDESFRVDEYLKDFTDLFTKEQFGHVHIVDGMPGGHLALGDGLLDLDRCFSDLENAGYEGYMTLEVMNPRYYEEPEAAVKQSFDWYLNWLDRKNG